MKDYRKEEKIVQAYTSSENNEQIYEMTFNCAEVVELMQIAVKNLSLSVVVQAKPEKVCKGSMRLGTGCGKCKRCKRELEHM
jgi:hypothetical protein